MIRVITSNGFGNVSTLGPLDDLSGWSTNVDMEKNDALGRRQTFQRRSVYEFGDHMVVRVVNIARIGVYSSILPFVQPISAYRVYHAAVPDGETRFLLNLVAGVFEVNNRGGPLTNRFLHLQTWMDRWWPEPSGAPFSMKDSLDTVISEFDTWEKGCTGTSGGIFAPVLLDLEKMRIVRFAIAVTANRGVIYSKRF